MSLYKILHAFQVTDNVKIIQFGYLEGGCIEFQPGQHVDINFYGQNCGVSVSESRSFSITSTPLEKEYLEVAVSNNGEFRQKLCNASVGSLFEINGLGGEFVFDDNSTLSSVFIAGGGGIAPIMSMLRYVSIKFPEKRCVMFYTCKTEKDIFFQKELISLTERLKDFICNFVMTRSMSDKPGLLDNSSEVLGVGKDNTIEGRVRWVNGHIDEPLLLSCLDDISLKEYYICGPYELMIMVNLILQKIGVDSSRVNSELW